MNNKTRQIINQGKSSFLDDKDKPQIRICRDPSAKFLKNSFEELEKFGKFWKVFSYRNLEKTCFPN